MIVGMQMSLPIMAADDNRIKKANQCTKLEQKIQRLACFDNVFSTPIYGVKNNTNKPKAWSRAIDSELKRESGHAPLLTVSKNAADLWVTMPATNSELQDAPPLLILSCIGGLSRVELALRKPLKEGRVQISLGANKAELWRSDDSGLLLSSARGVAAFKHIKNLLAINSATIRSNNLAIDGLKFSAINLRAALNPVRERCGW